MALPNIFTKEVSADIIERIGHLKANSQPKWGTMSVAQMLAHCGVTYEMVYDDIHPKPNFFIKFILKMIVKKTVTNEGPYQLHRNLLSKKPKILKLKRNV